jgi:hypothetical protein
LSSDDDSSRDRGQTQKNVRAWTTAVAFLILVGLLLGQRVSRNHGMIYATDDEEQHLPVWTVTPRDGFPSYLEYNAAGPMTVSYTARSLVLNGDPVLLLGGSLHPVRATPGTWELALDQVVQNGLNLVTIYVVWAAHQPLAHSPLDWSLQTKNNNWTLADAIRSCARRGLFVHIRVGPYDCAEYSYGGIPEWLPLQHPTMRMRRFDPDWMEAMEGFVATAFSYLTEHQLWAQQGGPILLAQIENELGSEDGLFMQDSSNQNSSSTGESSSSPTVQDYADWCGAMAARHAPDGVVLTMCNGLSANNTILTYNGDFTLVPWLERHGDTGRIQLDQPALWTEDEGGFQLWGEDSAHPTDYFWGHTARQMASMSMKWFARGGTHLNYYMVRRNHRVAE